jgi:SAM-dependent methyltransferase
MNAAPIEYLGKDLEAMSFAEAYHRWILDLMRPFLGKHIVEVGAGTGSFSKLLLETKPESLALVEPSAMFDTLRSSVSADGNLTKLRLYHSVFSAAANKIHSTQPPDSILYVNVLEHIEDDVAELQLAREKLAPGGRVFIFVPAMPVLFSKFDRHIGHYRRYGRKELKAKAERAGFNLLMLRWFDLAGIFPWLVKYRLLRSLKMEPAAVNAYDRIAVPVMRPIERLIHPPFGKNLLLIGEGS